MNIRHFELPNAGAGVGAYSTFLEIGGYQPGSGIWKKISPPVANPYTHLDTQRVFGDKSNTHPTLVPTATFKIKKERKKERKKSVNRYTGLILTEKSAHTSQDHKIIDAGATCV